MPIYHSHNEGSATVNIRIKQRGKEGHREDLRSGFLKQHVNVGTPEKMMIKKKESPTDISNAGGKSSNASCFVSL